MGKGEVRKSFDRAVAAARRQKIINARHSGTIAAARALADKIDQWDRIVQWAVEDKDEFDLARPAVPQNDNVSLPSFLKYCEALGLTVSADRAQVKSSGSAGKGASGVSKLEALQQGVGHKIA